MTAYLVILVISDHAPSSQTFSKCRKVQLVFQCLKSYSDLNRLVITDDLLWDIDCNTDYTASFSHSNFIATWCFLLFLARYLRDFIYLLLFFFLIFQQRKPSLMLGTLHIFCISSNNYLAFSKRSTMFSHQFIGVDMVSARYQQI